MVNLWYRGNLGNYVHNSISSFTNAPFLSDHSSFVSLLTAKILVKWMWSNLLGKTKTKQNGWKEILYTSWVTNSPFLFYHSSFVSLLLQKILVQWMCSTMDVIKFIWDKDEYKTKNGLRNVIHMSINFIKYIYIYTLNLTIMSLLGTLSIDNGCIIPDV